jgi:hypothetical protein
VVLLSFPTIRLDSRPQRHDRECGETKSLDVINLVPESVSDLTAVIGRGINCGKRFHDGEIASALSCVELISQMLSIRMCFDTKKDMRMASSS